MISEGETIERCHIIHEHANEDEDEDTVATCTNYLLNVFFFQYENYVVFLLSWSRAKKVNQTFNQCHSSLSYPLRKLSWWLL